MDIPLLWTGAEVPERATPILSLSHAVSIDYFIFRQVLDYFFPPKFMFRSAQVLISLG